MRRHFTSDWEKTKTDRRRKVWWVLSAVRGQNHSSTLPPSATWGVLGTLDLAKYRYVAFTLKMISVVASVWSRNWWLYWVCFKIGLSTRFRCKRCLRGKNTHLRVCRSVGCWERAQRVRYTKEWMWSSQEITVVLTSAIYMAVLGPWITP